MPRRNSQDRPRRRSQSSPNSDQGRNSGNSSPRKKSNSAGAGKRPRPTGSKEKFDSEYPRRSAGQQKPFQQRRKSSSDPAEDFKRKDNKSRRSTDTSNSQRPFKATGKEISNSGLRRERPYKKAEHASQPFSDGKDTSAPRSRPYKKVGESKKSYDTGAKTQPDLKAPAQKEKMRLNRFIANSGVCSRREADELIKMGLISVNGKVITEMGYKVNPGDEVRHESKVLRAERPVYILMNKPKGFLTTTSDPQERNTVMHLIGNKVKERVYPVGRLDRNTTGLILFTNDGELADKLMHPSYNVKKIYKVELDRPLTKADAQQILEGVRLDEGKAIVDDLAIISDDKRTVGLEIHIGWNRVVRRIFESLNYEVIKLDRSVYAGLDKKNLGRGEWRFLTKEELVRLKHY
jgi:23S rRNA pseudouridine2605 synthase